MSERRTNKMLRWKHAIGWYGWELNDGDWKARIYAREPFLTWEIFRGAQCVTEGSLIFSDRTMRKRIKNVMLALKEGASCG